MEKKQKKIKGNFAAAVLTILLSIGMIIFAGTPVYAAGDTAVRLNLNSRSNINNVPFEVVNMVPGDIVSNKYDVKVSYEETVTVRFRANIREGYEKLAEVLGCKVVLLNTGELLYDGLMKDMPDSVDYKLAASEDAAGSADLIYEITTYLDTKVGNEYQEKSLVADFVWWVEETENLTPPESGGILDVLPDEVVDKLPEGLGGVLTGDISDITVWCVVSLGAAAVLVYLIYTKKWSKTGKKLAGSIVLTVFLLAGFSVAAYALVHTLLSVETNSFQTGSVNINLNGGEPVIEEDEFLFEPGMTVVKDFFVENESTIDVYYRVYLENAEGRLADILDVTLKEGDAVLYKGKASGMTATGVDSPEDTMEPGEVRWLSISFYYPCDGGNSGQNTQMSFDVCAEAVQTKNNPDKEFD